MKTGIAIFSHGSSIPSPNDSVRAESCVAARQGGFDRWFAPFVFRVEDLESFSYGPGQFVSFTAEIKGSPITRAYSIASPPNGRRFDLCLNRVVEGHLSPYLFDLKPGDPVQMTGP